MAKMDITTGTVSLRPSYEQVPVGETVNQMYSVLKMREYRIYFLLLEKIQDAVMMLSGMCTDESIQDKDFKYLYATDIRPIIKNALEESNVIVTTTSVIFPDPVEDSSYIRLSEEESNWESRETKQTPKRCQSVRNFIRGVAINLANLAYTPYPDVEFLKRQSKEISVLWDRCFVSSTEFM